MTSTETLMRHWLESGTEAQKVHARNRIAIGFDEPAIPASLPSLLTRVITATTAAVTFVASGFETLPEADVQARLAICDGCEQRTGNGICNGCGCFLAGKARLPHEDCPMGKWPTPKAPQTDAPS